MWCDDVSDFVWGIENLRRIDQDTWYTMLFNMNLRWLISTIAFQKEKHSSAGIINYTFVNQVLGSALQVVRIN